MFSSTECVVFKVQNHTIPEAGCEKIPVNEKWANVEKVSYHHIVINVITNTSISLSFNLDLIFTSHGDILQRYMLCNVCDEMSTVNIYARKLLISPIHLKTLLVLLFVLSV